MIKAATKLQVRTDAVHARSDQRGGDREPAEPGRGARLGRARQGYAGWPIARAAPSERPGWRAAPAWPTSCARCWIMVSVALPIRELLGDGNNPEIWDVVCVYCQSAKVTAAAPGDEFRKGGLECLWRAGAARGRRAEAGLPLSGRRRTRKATTRSAPASPTAPVTPGACGQAAASPLMSRRRRRPRRRSRRRHANADTRANRDAGAGRGRSAARAPVAVANPGFGYGVQAHMLGNDKNRVAELHHGDGLRLGEAAGGVARCRAVQGQLQLGRPG